MKTGLVILISILIVLIAVFLLGINIFFTKKGEFPNIHVGGNKGLKEKGIKCATTQDAEAQKKRSFDINKIVKEIDEK